MKLGTHPGHLGSWWDLNCIRALTRVPTPSQCPNYFLDTQRSPSLYFEGKTWKHNLRYQKDQIKMRKLLNQYLCADSLYQGRDTCISFKWQRSNVWVKFTQIPYNCVRYSKIPHHSVRYSKGGPAPFLGTEMVRRCADNSHLPKIYLSVQFQGFQTQNRRQCWYGLPTCQKNISKIGINPNFRIQISIAIGLKSIIFWTQLSTISMSLSFKEPNILIAIVAHFFLKEPS